MELDRFLIEDVRCFKGPQEVRIRPLTFLVGENSTGKTTVLACMQALADYMRGDASVGPWGHSAISFNQHPYEMGSFQDIVRRSRPLLTSFKLGLAFRDSTVGRASYLATLQERQGGARAGVAKTVWAFGNRTIIIRRSRESRGHRDTVRPKLAADGTSLDVGIAEPFFGRLQSRPWMLSMRLDHDDQARQFLESLHPAFGRRRSHHAIRPLGLSIAQSIAPVRSRPERTYHPFVDAPDAEGAEIPAELADMARRGGKPWHDLKNELEDLGRTTGLFSEVTIRRMGRSGSDPFQLQIRTRGSKANLKDVGYGVSQALPILVHLLQSPRTVTSLIQQPEVHLHPQAQAALSSILIAVLYKKHRSRRRPLRFVVETHSDYMLDRARIAIRRGQIDPDSVSLVYFESRYRKGVRIHNITFDEMGNMENVPPTYRQFFLKETDALLGIDE